MTEQYDRYVRGDTVLAMPHDAGLLRIDESTGLGVALATDGNGRYCQLDPYAGTQLALAEAYRNVAVSGARPLAVTNCLNFGSPEDPAVMWQFTEAVRGLADGCQQLGIPVTGGNVSFYNQTGSAPIQPTPVVGVLGVHDDVRRRVPSGFSLPGASIVLLGRDQGRVRRLAVGLAAARSSGRAAAGRGPRGRAGARRRADRGGRRAACSSRRMTCPTAGSPSRWPNHAWPAGPAARSTLPADPATFLFSESAGRAVVAVRPGAEAELAGPVRAGRRAARPTLGETGGTALEVSGLFAVPLDELAGVHRGARCPALFG